MKKYLPKFIIVIVLGLLVIPQITFAAWWNPLSWFDKTKPVEPTKEENFSELINQLTSKPPIEKPTIVTSKIISSDSPVEQKVVRLYVKSDNTRVRSCESTNCDVLGYYHQNSTIDIATTNPQVSLSISELLKEQPEWIPLSFSDGKFGYIHKSTLSTVPTKIIEHKSLANNNESVMIPRLSNQGEEIKRVQAIWDTAFNNPSKESLDIINNLSGY